MKPKKNFTRGSLSNKALQIFSAYIVKYCNNPIEGDGLLHESIWSVKSKIIIILMDKSPSKLFQ